MNETIPFIITQLDEASDVLITALRTARQDGLYADFVDSLVELIDHINAVADDASDLLDNA